jgi:hypothetical protein
VIGFAVELGQFAAEVRKRVPHDLFHSPQVRRIDDGAGTWW